MADYIATPHLLAKELLFRAASLAPGRYSAECKIAEFAPDAIVLEPSKANTDISVLPFSVEGTVQRWAGSTAKVTMRYDAYSDRTYLLGELEKQ